jgi:cell division protein FtsL
MSKYFSLCRAGLKSAPKKQKSRRHGSFSAKSNLIFRVVLLMFLVVAVFGYVVSVNTSSVKGFEISQLEQKIVALDKGNKQLAEDLGSLKTFARVEDKIKELNMVSVGNIEYLVQKNSVAMAK